MVDYIIHREAIASLITRYGGTIDQSISYCASIRSYLEIGRRLSSADAVSICQRLLGMSDRIIEHSPTIQFLNQAVRPSGSKFFLFTTYCK